MFSIKGKTFQFQMSDCNKRIAGVCPVECDNKEIDCRCNEIKEELERTSYEIVV